MPDAPGLELIAQGIEKGHQGTVIETSVEHDAATLIVNPEGVLHALGWLRDTEGQGYRFLSSLHAADYLPATPRFAVHYELLCRERMERIHVKALLADPAPGAELRTCRPTVEGSTSRSWTPASICSRRLIFRNGRPTTSSGSSSAATRTCAES